MNVDDACEGIAVVTEKGEMHAIYNLGTHHEISIIELAKIIHKEVDRQMGRTTDFAMELVPDRPYNDRRYFIDFNKAKMELGWECRIPFEQGLKKTVSWYLNPMKDTMTEHIMIFGGQGWIGKQFTELLHDANTSYSLALTRPGFHPDEEVETELIKLSPTHVISFIGRTHGPGSNTIEYLEGGPDKLMENLRDNLYAPWLLAALSHRLGIHFTYVGTGCLFQYDDKHPVGGPGFKEDDIPNYVGNSYGVAKQFTDRMMHHFPTVLNIRIRLPINFLVDKRNLICKVANYSSVFDIPDNISVLPDILPILLELMQKREAGTLNLVNPGVIRHSDTLQLYRKYIDPEKKWRIVREDSEEAERMRSSRAHCALDTAKLQSLYPSLRSATEAIEEGIKEIAEKMGKTHFEDNNKLRE